MIALSRVEETSPLEELCARALLFVAQVRSESAMVNLKRGKAYLSKGRPSAALTYWGKASQLDPLLPEVYLSRGKFRLGRNWTRLARQDFSKALALDPRNSDAYLQRGKAFRLEGRIEEAISDFRSGIRALAPAPSEERVEKFPPSSRRTHWVANLHGSLPLHSQRSPEYREFHEKLAEHHRLLEALAEQEQQTEQLREQHRTFVSRHLGKLLEEFKILLFGENRRKTGAPHTTKEALTEAVIEKADPVLKKLYREAVRILHPDLAPPKSRAILEERMAAVNLAYGSRDSGRIKVLLEEWLARPDQIEGDSFGDSLVRLIRANAQLKLEISSSIAEYATLQGSPLHELLLRTERSRLIGVDNYLASLLQSLDC